MNLKSSEITQAQITDKHLHTSDTLTLQSKKTAGAKSERHTFRKAIQANTIKVIFLDLITAL